MTTDLYLKPDNNELLPFYSTGGAVLGGILYAGVILGGGGKGTVFPYGWSISGTTTRTVTHNLGTTNYSVIAQAIKIDGNVQIAQVSSVAANSFVVSAYGQTSGVPSPVPVHFLLIRQPNLIQRQGKIVL